MTENELIAERYALSAERIRGILSEKTVREPYRDYFCRTAEFIGLCGTVMEAVRAGENGNGGGLKEWGGERLREINRRLYEDIMPGRYETSYVNPAYAAKALGRGLGKLLCFLYAEIRGDIVYAFEGRMLEMTAFSEAFIEIYNLFEDEGIPSDQSVRDILYWCESDYCDVFLPYRVRETLDPSLDFAKRIITEADLSDLTYLYRFGEYISPQTERMADFLNGLPEETIRRMADTFTDGYIRGFQVMGRDLSKKKNAAVRCPLGMERVVRQAIKNLEAAGLSVIIPRIPAGSLNRNPSGNAGYSSDPANRQYDYDHRFDSALYLDRAFRERKLAVLKNAYETYRREAEDYAGPAVIETFGEPGFTPENRPEAWAFNSRQRKLHLDYRNASMQLINEYMPGDETSFTIIAFPVPAIGPDFEEIFAGTVRINTLDHKLYERMQQRLIDVLDTAEYVEIKGCGENRTDMKVCLAEISDPNRQTKFENCLADVNIPLGEVFTSPKLSGTCGLLNVSGVYIDGIRYRNLTMEFKDGRVTAVSCDNFADPEEGRKLVVQGIMNNHESLPLGEFAIGTNTAAYAMAERFGIIDRLPILIVEKMGPHFAVGDTCYSWSEDSPMYNPDGKEMIARDNEVSILRKTDVSGAYFGVHTDITIPYRELGRITAVLADGTRTEIIENGRFVLPGLEPLNEALDGIRAGEPASQHT